MSGFAKQIIQDAREILEQGGWIRDDFQDGSAHCLVGALAVADGQVLRDHEDMDLSLSIPTAVTRPLLKALFQIQPDTFWSAHEPGAVPLVRWNDRVAQSAEDVILLLKQAEEMCDE